MIKGYTDNCFVTIPIVPDKSGYQVNILAHLSYAQGEL